MVTVSHSGVVGVFLYCHLVGDKFSPGSECSRDAKIKICDSVYRLVFLVHFYYGRVCDFRT